MKTHKETLKQKIEGSQFQPEIYIYPTPRMYDKVTDFDLNKVQFTHDIDLYVHTPFCRQICSFCGYLKMKDSEEIREDHVNAQVKEIQMYEDILKDRNIKTLHFGGGTPSLLSVPQFEKLIHTIYGINPRLFETAQEISIETTPELVLEFEDKFREFRNLGLTRVSMGMQSLNDDEIELCGRKNYSAISEQAIKTLKDMGIENVVADLMIGIEGQSVESFRKSVQKLLTFKPDTVELYGLALMPNTKIVKSKNQLMTSGDVYECFDIAQDLFLEAGYIQEDYNRYSLLEKGGFLQEDHVFEGNSLIGFGAGTRTYAHNKHYRNAYSKKNRNAILQYIDDINSGRLSVGSAVELSEDEKMRQFVIFNSDYLDLNKFEQAFGIAFQEKFPELYKEMLETDLYEQKENILELKKRALKYTDLIGRQFYSEESEKREQEYRPVK